MAASESRYKTLWVATLGLEGALPGPDSQRKLGFADVQNRPPRWISISKGEVRR